MGTTKDALNAGSTSYVWVAAIYGYPYLLTDASPAQASTAWAGDAHYSQALGGLHVELDNHQRLDPESPFTAGGSLTLRVEQTTAADTFGVDTHRRDAGAETELTETIDNDATTIPVKSTANFPASGEAYLGNECFGYTGTTPTSFTGCIRGKYAPFSAETVTDLFGQYHRTGIAASGGLPVDVNIKPKVTSIPRHWRGKWIGLWAHRVVGGVLDTKAEAHLVYAGRIEEIQDDPATMSTVVSCKHVLDYVSEAPVGHDLWSGKIPGGIYLQSGWTFEMVERVRTTSVTVHTANPLTVTSPAVGPNEIEPGHHTRDSLFDALNQWWQAETAAANLTGDYAINIATNPDTGLRTKIYWSIPSATTAEVAFEFGLHHTVADFLGYGSQIFSVMPLGQGSIGDEGDEDTPYHYPANEDPKIIAVGVGPYGNPRVMVTDEIGTFHDQYASMPTPMKESSSGGLEWGCFLVDGKHLFTGTYVAGELSNFKISPHLQFTAATTAEVFSRAFTEDGPNELAIKQVFVLELDEDDALMQFLYSTGTVGYNHVVHDKLPFGLGLAVPAALLGNAFEASCAALPGADHTMVAVIDKPTKLGDLFAGDLVLRRAFLRWADQHLEFKTWTTPVTSGATVTLEEANKAAPAGTQDHHRTTSIESSEWARPITKIQYDRDATDASSQDGYRSTLTIVDAGAIDDAGGEAPMATVKARNTFAQFANTGAGVEALLPDFVAMHPMFARPMRFMTRSIAPTMFEQIAAGDTVLVSDNFARDPETGLREFSSRPATIISKRDSPGGAVPGSDKAAPMGGEVELLLMDVDRFAAYVPAAQLDDTTTNRGYVVATKVATCYAHKYSEGTEAVDASRMLVGHKIKFVEIDPPDPAAPSTHDDTVAAQSGNTITLTTGFAAFDTSKEYRIIFDSYGDATAAQQLFCYQADDADGMIVDTTPPREYAVGQGVGTYTPSAAADLVELPPNLSYGDGAARDTGHEFALARLVNNIIDYKSTRQCAVLHNTVLVWSAGGTHKLVAYEQVYFGEEILGTGITRSLTVGVWIRSSDGTSGTVRVRLSKTPPTGDDLFDLDPPTIYAEGSVSSTSTTWATSADITLDMRVKAFSGFAYLWIEVTEKAQTRGVSKMVEGQRVIV